jgi:hypothetical protein
MRRFYFTFGTGRPYRDHYVVIEADDRSTARDVMFDAHGEKWAFDYNEDEWEANKQRPTQCLARMIPSVFGYVAKVGS